MQKKKGIFSRIIDYFWEPVEDDDSDIIINYKNHTTNTNKTTTSSNPALEHTIHYKGPLLTDNQQREQLGYLGDSSRETIEETSATIEPKKEDDDMKTKAKDKKGFFIAAVLTFAVFVLSFSGYLVANQYFGSNATTVDEGDTSETNNGGLLSLGSKEPAIKNLLLIGVDERPGQGARSDTVILADFSMEDSKLKLKMLSIPRDTRVEIPKRGTDKINHSQAFGGPELLVETVNNLLDMEVDKYVQVNFNSFKDVVDILGGIEYTVERRMYYPAEKINLKAGTQLLNGDKALQYVRYRSDGLGDVGRVERQQNFIKEFAKQKLELKNVLKIPELVSEVYPSVKTNLTLKEMLQLGKNLKDLQPENLTTATLPGEPKYIGGVSYWLPKSQDFEEIFLAIEAKEAEEAMKAAKAEEEKQEARN